MSNVHHLLATDVIAFGIGGFTVLPALQSFCLYASVGIVTTYIFQSSFFVACMTLDQRRIEAGRNGCCPCYVHTRRPRDGPTRHQPSLLQSLFARLGSALMLRPVKVAIIVITLIVTGIGIWGNILLKQVRSTMQVYSWTSCCKIKLFLFIVEYGTVSCPY
jgi:predicted RND superfamily exporter protein